MNSKWDALDAVRSDPIYRGIFEIASRRSWQYRLHKARESPNMDVDDLPDLDYPAETTPTFPPRLVRDHLKSKDVEVAEHGVVDRLNRLVEAGFMRKESRAQYRLNPDIGKRVLWRNALERLSGRSEAEVTYLPLAEEMLWSPEQGELVEEIIPSCFLSAEAEDSGTSIREIREDPELADLISDFREQLADHLRTEYTSPDGTPLDVDILLQFGGVPALRVGTHVVDESEQDSS